jgi:hypothetical protein
METLTTTFTETKSFLEKISRLPYPEMNMFVAILTRNEDEINNMLNMFDILEKPYPDWVNAFVNAHDLEIGRDEAIEDAISTYLTLGEF